MVNFERRIPTILYTERNSYRVETGLSEREAFVSFLVVNINLSSLSATQAFSPSADENPSGQDQRAPDHDLKGGT